MTDSATAQPDLWVLGLARGTTSRLTSDPATDWFPAWSADGGRLLFGSNRLGVTTPFQKVVGGGQEEPAAEGVFRAAGATSPSDTSGDGRLLLYTQLTQRGYDLGVLTLTGERKASTFLGTPFNEAQARFSPNSRWVAYASDESGRFEVYVRPFPAASGQTQISIAGGTATGVAARRQGTVLHLRRRQADRRAGDDRRSHLQRWHTATHYSTSRSPSRTRRSQLTTPSPPMANGSSSTPSSISRRARR